MDGIKLVQEQLAVAVRAPAQRNAFEFKFQKTTTAIVGLDLS